MSTFIRLFCCIIVLFLSACASQPKNADKMHSLGQCKVACKQHFDLCKKNCIDTCSNCSSSASHYSKSNYTKYVQEQQIEGGFVTRELNSYRDPLQCRKITCNCTADFNICTQSCTGVIQKRLEAVPYCA